MAKQPKQPRPIFEDISIAEVNLALEKLLKDKIHTTDVFNKKRTVPVYFQARDSKIIADSTPSGLIEIEHNSLVRAEGGYQLNGCDIFTIVTCDANGNALEYQKVEAPEVVFLLYTVRARSDNWNDIIKIQSRLDKHFPVNHTVLDIKGNRMHLFREGFNAADDAELGIFIREYSLRILGYIYGLDCDENRVIVPAIRDAFLEVTSSPDPDAEPSKIITIVEC